jgi:hypothetical protein
VKITAFTLVLLHQRNLKFFFLPYFVKRKIIIVVAKIIAAAVTYFFKMNASWHIAKI